MEIRARIKTCYAYLAGIFFISDGDNHRHHLLHNTRYYHWNFIRIAGIRRRGDTHASVILALFSFHNIE